MLLKRFGILICFFISSKLLVAQGYLDFIENKGQWDKNVKFRSNLPQGSFLLQNTGYRVIQHNPEDLSRIAEATHRHPDITQPGKLETAGKPVPQGITTVDDITLRSHAYEVKFLNANPNAQIISEKPLTSYNNYFIGNDPTKWASNCKIFQTVTYKNVYPNIDVRYYTANGTLKYDIVVNPGGDLSKVILYFDGVDGLTKKEERLQIKTSVGTVEETAPYSYQLTGEGKKDVSCSYDVKGNFVRFKANENYDKNSILVIDPTIVFVSFSGSRSDNWGFTATYDGLGNFYAGGISFGVGFPISNGAYQQQFGGGTPIAGTGGIDMGILKFAPDGTTLLYSTFLGGSGNEQPHSLVVDAGGNLIIAGRTSSGASFPAINPLQSLGPGGNFDIVIAKLNPNGTSLIGSIRIGGTQDDGVNVAPNYGATSNGVQSSTMRNYGDDARSEVIVDKQGNILVASVTQSLDFPITAGAFQPIGGAAANGRFQDAVLIKLNNNLSAVIFSSFLGGNNDDAAFVLSVNPTNGNIYVAGATASTNMPGSTNAAAAFQTNKGQVDGFVSIVNATGTQIISTSYFGTSGNDVIYGIQFDKSGMPYITGTTTVGFPVINSPYNTADPSQNVGKHFISKLQPDLSSYIFSANFGPSTANNPSLSLTAFLVDRCGNMYVSGWGGAALRPSFALSPITSLPITPDAYQKTTDGADFYFFVLKRDASSLLYATFFGQNGGYPDHVDGGTSRFDANGTIYQSICSCNTNASFSNSLVGTPGSWSPTRGVNLGCNLLAIKLSFNLAGVGAGPRSAIKGVIRDTTGCVPLTVDFSDTLLLAKSYIWNFGDGSPSVSTTNPSISHQYNLIGLYRVQLIAIDSSSCNISDTSYLTIRVRNDQANLNFSSTKLPPCASLAYRFDNLTTAIKPFTNTSFRWDFGDGTKQLAGIAPVTHTYAAAGTYDVKLILIDSNYCNEPDSVIQQLRIAPNVTARFQTPAVGCVPYNAVFTNTSIAGQTFRWDFGDGSTLTTNSNGNITHLYNNSGSYTVKLVAIDPATCNISDSTTFTLSVRANPRSGFVYNPNPTLPNSPINFVNQSFGGTRYQWRFGDGDSLNTILRDTTVKHLYNATGTFNACLVAYNDAGCSDTSCQSLNITIVPGFDVPNAFTPNGDGVNDKIYVRGFGIAKMTWRIYNRWGQTVYVGTNPSEGWDGTFNGKLQPQEVYHYTVQIEFSNKEKATKKGDITLLR
ncbi:MAG: PKD domain-containing protein [Chitinophagaceae bacterium]|nr:PKD domain-containing protein [Chitinophagaceae bacterium]